MDFLSDLQWRGLVKDLSSEAKFKNAEKMHHGLYCGFDPTANSLHVGHLLLITTLERARRNGLQPIALIGGGTGMIGDPSFRSQERILLSESAVAANVQAIKKQLSHLIPNVRLINNKDWLGGLDLITFLRDIGKMFNVTYLMSKEAITKRIPTGLSVTEFLYPILQAYDFYWLYKHERCRLEIGGSDQWGNITSGLDLIHSQYGNESEAAGLTIPLLVRRNGEKFGKTASGTMIWLDPKKTTPYAFYQFWLNQNDEEALKLIKSLTFFSAEEIDLIIEASKVSINKRFLQSVLAKEMTVFVHGAKGYEQAKELSEALFKGDLHHLDAKLRANAMVALPTFTLERGISVANALVNSKITASKREAREFIRDKTITINGRIVASLEQLVSEFAIDDSHFFVVKRGKRNYFIWELQ